MKLGELAGTVPASSGGVRPLPGSETQITGLAFDSRKVRAGDLFFCVSGFNTDGHDFAAAAVSAGAAALVCERPLGLGVPEVLLHSARAAMAPIAARFFEEPSSELSVVGVTGTNGKTTTAYLVRALMQATGRQCGLLGTVKSIIGGLERSAARTTPEAIDLQADLRAMLDGGDRACAMEVSSHALALGRTAAISFAAAIFTNLTQDHLDFHPTMEDYFTAKRRLFLPGAQDLTTPPPRVSVVNIGDPYGARLAAEVSESHPLLVTFAVGEPADYSASEIACDLHGCSLLLHTPEGQHRLRLPMPGRFNVANALGALAAVHALGGDLTALIAALQKGVRVPGRLEPLQEGQDFAVLIDYAHTPDSLENVLAAARELVDGSSAPPARVICVFGAGGDRDRGKRPLMGEIAARLADLVFVTSDNPRSERPEDIIDQIMSGIPAAGGQQSPSVSRLTDRREAITAAVAGCHAGDVLIIAGKGHEQGQEFADGHKVPFDDLTVAREALRATIAEAGVT